MFLLVLDGLEAGSALALPVSVLIKQDVYKNW
jgi:hypothetical protein